MFDCRHCLWPILLGWFVALVVCDSPAQNNHIAIRNGSAALGNRVSVHSLISKHGENAGNVSFAMHKNHPVITVHKSSVNATATNIEYLPYNASSRREVAAGGLHRRYRENRPSKVHNTAISLINATPYKWRRIYSHDYQMIQWTEQWPEEILPGNTATCLAINDGYEFKYHRDSAGEVTYQLVGTHKPASFQVQYLPGGIQHDVVIEFREELETLNNAKLTTHNLGFNKVPGGQGFLLAGLEGEFISNDGPLAWMQSQLPEIGHLPLREILLPRSHHTGMSRGGKYFGGGVYLNTRTQTEDLYQQAGNGGVRVFDVRPLLLSSHWREWHGTQLGIMCAGATGARINEMIDQLNQFMDEYPGELFIWDVHYQDARNGDHGCRPVESHEVKDLYEVFKRLNHRLSVPENKDLTKLPLDQFISRKGAKRGKSGVLIRVPIQWAKEWTTPMGQEGFVSSHNFPLHYTWANTDSDERMVAEQIANLYESRSSRDATMYDMQWILTQQGINVVIPDESIIHLNRGTWKTLFSDLWDALTDKTYPNMLTMDAIHGNQQKAFAMAVNKCLAARGCGYLSGKVSGLNVSAPHDHTKRLSTVVSKNRPGEQLPSIQFSPRLPIQNDIAEPLP